MNTTNLLLGLVGLLLLGFVVTSAKQMGEEETSDEYAALKREIAALEEEQASFKKKRQQTLTPLIYHTSSAPSAPKGPTEEELREQQAAAESKAAIETLVSNSNNLTTQVQNMQRDLEDLRQSPPVPEPLMDDMPDVSEVAVATEPEAPNPRERRREFLITSATLQGTVQAFEAEDGFIIIESGPQANFRVGDQLAIRRNNGILCTFTVSGNAVDGSFIAEMHGNLAGGVTNVQVGDELILPPPFQGDPSEI